MSQTARKRCGGCAARRAATAVKGLVILTRAELTRDRTPVQVRIERLRVCGQCDDRTLIDGRMWCGEPLVETETTCGCRCDLKAGVASERCPQGKWSE